MRGRKILFCAHRHRPGINALETVVVDNLERCDVVACRVEVQRHVGSGARASIGQRPQQILDDAIEVFDVGMQRDLARRIAIESCGCNACLRRPLVLKFHDHGCLVVTHEAVVVGAREPHAVATWLSEPIAQGGFAAGNRVDANLPHECFDRAVGVTTFAGERDLEWRLAFEHIGKQTRLRRHFVSIGHGHGPLRAGDGSRGIPNFELREKSAWLLVAI